MPSKIQVLPYSLDLLDNIIKDIKGQAAKNVTLKIIQCFYTKGFTIKVQHIVPAKSRAYYRILCFVKKSKETVSINTKTDGADVDIKIRIENHNTFDKLDDFTDNIRNQILNATDCHCCSEKCEEKNRKYRFVYQGKEYLKCQYLGCNFRFPKIEEYDIVSIIDIINGELAY